MIPVVAVVVQLVWVSAVFVCADIRAEIVKKMGSVSYVSSVVLFNTSTKLSLLPRLSCKSFSRAKSEAVRALEELFIGLRCRWRRESHCISGRLPC